MRVAVLAALCGFALLIPAGTAVAHPLGNFSVNHYHGLRIHPDRIDVKSIVDSAEIPTLQERPSLDADRDGVLSSEETSRDAARRCDDLARSLSATVDGQPLRWSVRGSGVEYPAGQAGLLTTRLTCELTTPTQINRPVTLSFSDSYRGDRVGWHEITAVGEGVALPGSPVQAVSTTNELRSYPDDLLSEPLDVRTVQLRAQPGVGAAPASGESTAGGPRIGHWPDRIGTQRPGQQP